MEETTQDTSRKPKPSRIIDSYVAQCEKCGKWRSIESQEEYEEIRSEALYKPFECKNSCEEPGDVDVGHDSTTVWLVDTHYGLPKTPQGLKRILVLRERGDATDVYYLTPQGKRLRSTREVASFIQDNESFKDTNIEDISFAKPKVMKKKTEFEDVDAAETKDQNKNAKRGRPKKKSQVSDDETSARADDSTKKNFVEVSDEDNDQKLQEVLSLEIPSPLENGEPSEKTPEAETHTHETPDKSEEKTKFEDVSAAETNDKNKDGKLGSPKKKSQVSDDETSATADVSIKKDSVEVSDEDNDQKLQEVLSLEISSPLENGEPSEKTPEAETHTHETPYKSEEKTLRDDEVSFGQKGCDILPEKTKFEDVSEAETKDKNKDGKRGSPKKKSQVSDDETSARADDSTKKDSVEVSDEDNDQKVQEVLSLEILSPLEKGEPSEKTPEAETNTHETPDKSEEKTLRDDEVSFAQKGCDILQEKAKFEDVSAPKTKEKNKDGKLGSPKKKSQVSDDETSARADDSTKKDSVEVSDEDNDQKVQEVLSLEILSPLEKGEPSEKTPEAETNTHETLDKSEEKTLPDDEVSFTQKGCDILQEKAKFEDVSAPKTKEKNKDGKLGSPKKKSQVSDDQTSATANDSTKKDSVEVSDEDNDQKLQEVLSLQIPSPLENGEPSEKTPEAETYTHETPDKSEEKTFCDVEVSPAQKGCDIRSKEKQNKESVVMNSDNEEEEDMPESLQNEKQATDKEIQSPSDVLPSYKGDATLSTKKRKRNMSNKTSKRKKQAMAKDRNASW